MTISDYSVLIFLAAAAMLMPRTLGRTMMLFGLSLLSAAISIATGNTELLIAVAGVLGALLLGFLSVGVSLWRYYWSDMTCRRWISAARQRQSGMELEPEQLRIGPVIS